MTFDNLIFRALCFPESIKCVVNVTGKRMTECGNDDSTVGYEYPHLQLYGVGIADPGPPETYITDTGRGAS